MGEMAKPFDVLFCTWNGLPLIYSGQELPNKKRLKFFDKDQIDWTGSCELHGFFRTLLQLRKRNPALRSGNPASTIHRLHHSLDDRCFAFARRAGKDQVLVLLNLSGEDLVLPVAELLIRGNWREAFTGNWVDFSKATHFILPPWGYAVYEKLNV
jgi:glycosidase